ncbi:MAG: hypothetical protein U0L22_02440 [Bacteroidales bacterium]|nr:hypothetical protein [Bacteroidales bacterium]MEE1142472.1 hypothetical protein [Bacteroidales bacterium]MEE1221541.1 hypothetical protein [Bacteroidales bacterium]MEE1301352.1 hypothetical protein [Bacteroidales bacterium]
MEEIKEILKETQKTLQGNNEELKKIEKKIITDKKSIILGSLSMLILEVVSFAYFMDYL